MSKRAVLAAVAVAAFLGAGAPSVTTFKDSRDGKVYKIVTIGKQVWMEENLNYDVPDDTTDACYNNNAGNCAKYGRLYNWFAANNACPAGFHLPTDKEWTALTDYAGGGKKAGTKLKSSTGWKSSNRAPAGTDKYGFSVLPGGYRNSDGSFYDAGLNGYYWGAKEYDADLAWYRYLSYESEHVDNYYGYKAYLGSVRCVQD